MTPEEREKMEIVYGLSIQPPAPRSVKNDAGHWRNMTAYECPDCGAFVREVGYNTHWAKAHRQDYQIDYFKRWKHGQSKNR